MPRAPYLFPDGCRIGVDNLVLHARASRHRVESFAGPASIKTVVTGKVEWMVAGRKLVVDPHSFLILSAGETYSMNIDAATPVETCCVFFAPGFVEQIAWDVTISLSQALDAPGISAPVLPYLSAWHGDQDSATVRRILNLRHRCSQMLAPSGFEEEFVELACDLLHLYERIRDQEGRIPAARASTRKELFRRLLIGREYLHAHAAGRISLAAVARSAGLSLFHFHRGFTHAFQQTPHSYLTRIRLQRARLLLENGSSVLDACLDIGFSSPSAFTRLFQSHYAQLPSAVVRKFARSGKKSY